jgi:hypothetical protein
MHIEWPDKRRRILDLTKNAQADAWSVDEVDGEFFWKICRDDKIEPLARPAASIALQDLNDSRNRGLFAYLLGSIASPQFKRVITIAGSQIN